MDKETELIIKWLNENGHAKVTSKIIPLDNGNFRPVVDVIYNCLQQVKKFDLADVGGNEVACDHDYKPIGGGFEKRCSNCNHKTIVE